MTIEKLTEFAKTGQKNTDDLDLETGFIVNRKPARQWFNWLFSTLTTKINEIIDADFMPKSDVVDNLTTNDATKVASARTVKELQDNKLEADDLKDASTTQKGIVQLVNNLTTGGADKALSAEQGKVLNDQAFGVGQTKKDVKGVKVLGSTYTNTTPRPIYITITTNAYDGSSDAISIYVDNELFSNFSQNTSFNNKATVLAVVNPGSSYRVDGVLKMINKWIEVS